MGRLDELWAFVRGTRPRPPPRPSAPGAALLLVLAGIIHLPVVYVLIADAGTLPVVSLFVGLVAMALAWAGGAALEGRRSGTAIVFSALGTIEFVVAFLPGAIPTVLGPTRWLLVISSACCAAAWAMLRRVAATSPLR